MSEFIWALTFLRPYRGRAAAIVVLAIVEIGLAALAPWPMKAIVDNVFGGQPFPGVLGGWAQSLTGGSITGLLLLVAAAGFALQLTLQLVWAVSTWICVSGSSDTCRRCRSAITC